MEAARSSKMSVNIYNQQSITFQENWFFKTAMRTSNLAKEGSLIGSAQIKI
jgi:hypothetical protein